MSCTTLLLSPPCSENLACMVSYFLPSFADVAWSYLALLLAAVHPLFWLMMLIVRPCSPLQIWPSQIALLQSCSFPLPLPTLPQPSTLFLSHFLSSQMRMLSPHTLSPFFYPSTNHLTTLRRVPNHVLNGLDSRLPPLGWTPLSTKWCTPLGRVPHNTKQGASFPGPHNPFKTAFFAD
jgi:hypothetical protein